MEARGVDCKCADNLGSNALHYAVQCDSTELVKLLLENGIDCNLVNLEGHSPLSLALRGKDAPALTSSFNLAKPIWKMLLTKQADTNIVYPENSHASFHNGLKMPSLSENKKRQSSSEDAPKKE